MKCGLTLILVSALILGVLQRSRVIAKPPATPTSWKLVWSDEFSNGDVDKSKWVIGDSSEPNFDGGINSYDPSNVYQVNDHLVIRATAYSKRGTHKTYYSAGRVTTKGKFSFLYGKVEVRAKLPGTQSLWPAIWLLQANGDWPPETDIVEMLGSDPTRVYMSLHFGSRRNERTDQSNFVGPDFTANYHIFTLEWSPRLLRWLVDGVERKRASDHVPDHAMYLRMNTSVGGIWPGNPNADTSLPQYFSIDYVRIYQAK